VENDFVHKFSSQSLADLLGKAMLEVSQDDVSFLAAGSKPEGVIRDRLAMYVHQRTDLIAAREWDNRTDLALLSKHGPEVLIELKVWTHFDAADEKKLRKESPKHGISGAFSSDAAKLKETGAELVKRFGMQPKLFTITVLFGVAVTDANEPFPGVVKYAGGHRQALKKFGNLNSLCDYGLQEAKKLFEKHGDTAIQYLGVGTTWGMSVRLDALVTEVVELR